MKGAGRPEAARTLREQHGNEHGRRLVLTPASRVEPVALEWLWVERLPLRDLAVLAGEPGLGKSTTTTELAARVSRGQLDGALLGTPRDVLIATAEDHFESVVWGRLKAAGADMDRVHHVTIEDPGSDGLITLPHDVDAIERACRKLSNEGQPVALICIDPIGAFLSEQTDSHREAAVRRALTPLASLGRDLQVCILAVAHLNKSTASRLLDRVAGSKAFGAAPRSVLAFARDPDDPDGERGEKRVIVHAKSNHGSFAPTLAAHIEGVEVPVVGNVSRLVIDGESDIGPEDLVGERAGRSGSDIEAEIGDALAGGPQPSHRIKATIARESGCSEKTVERHGAAMARRGEIVITAEGFPRRTMWSLHRYDNAGGTGGAIGPVPTERVLTANDAGHTDVSGPGEASRDKPGGSVPTAQAGQADEQRGAACLNPSRHRIHHRVNPDTGGLMCPFCEPPVQSVEIDPLS